MEQSRKYQRCDVFALDIHRSSFAAHLRNNNHLLKTVGNIGCEICKVFLISGPDYDNHLLTEEHRARLDLAASIRNIRFETCNKDIRKNVYENHS